jgi:uncharacterized SAM-binding protein YcdF (DUF218 family)
MILLSMIGALICFTRFRDVGKWVALVGVSLLVVCGFSPLGRALLLPLEERFVLPVLDRAPTGIVVLGGALDGKISKERGVIELAASGDRVIAAAMLARQYPDLRIVLSGGSGELFPSGEPEAQLAGRLFEALGIPKDRIVLEDKSRDTAENARYSKALAEPKPSERWLLVTSAAHMPRAVGAFRHAGFNVVPYPVDWRTSNHSDLARLSFAASEGLSATDQGMHEWLGLLIYWSVGRTSEVLPQAELPQ